MSNAAISSLVLTQPPGRSLQQQFYIDPDIYAREVDRIFFKSWQYVGHINQAPEKGDYFLFSIAGESLIIINKGEGEIAAHINVCRHRGSRVLSKECGHENLLVCPYHGWTYQLDGRLRGAGHTGSDFDKAKYGLKQVHVRLLHGLIFINFDRVPTPFDPIEQDLYEPLKPHGLGTAKVAYRKNYPLKANWKLAVENYCECYHCVPSHPEYSVAHGRAIPNEEMQQALKEVMARAESCGMTPLTVRKDWKASGGVGIDRSYDRYVLYKGHVTGSRDGKPVAPLMGDLKGYDGGTTDMHFGPTTFALLYCDHMVIYRFTPTALDACDCEITWLVRGNAVEGKDYKLDELLWLWEVTTVADKRIIEDNAAGVMSRFYEPGPYTKMEDFAHRFIEWYLDAMK